MLAHQQPYVIPRRRVVAVIAALHCCAAVAGPHRESAEAPGRAGPRRSAASPVCPAQWPCFWSESGICPRRLVEEMTAPDSSNDRPRSSPGRPTLSTSGRKRVTRRGRKRGTTGARHGSSARGEQRPTWRFQRLPFRCSGTTADRLSHLITRRCPGRARRMGFRHPQAAIMLDSRSSVSGSTHSSSGIRHLRSRPRGPWAAWMGRDASGPRGTAVKAATPGSSRVAARHRGRGRGGAWHRVLV